MCVCVCELYVCIAYAVRGAGPNLESKNVVRKYNDLVAAPLVLLDEVLAGVDFVGVEHVQKERLPDDGHRGVHTGHVMLSWSAAPSSQHPVPGAHTACTRIGQAGDSGAKTDLTGRRT